jgi:hypothetical protein
MFATAAEFFNSLLGAYLTGGFRVGSIAFELEA